MVEQARDIIVKDTECETAVVGEDVLLTPRQSQGQPSSSGSSLAEAGDSHLQSAQSRNKSEELTSASRELCNWRLMHVLLSLNAYLLKQATLHCQSDHAQM